MGKWKDAQVTGSFSTEHYVTSQQSSESPITVIPPLFFVKFPSGQHTKDSIPGVSLVKLIQLCPMGGVRLQ